MFEIVLLANILIRRISWEVVFWFWYRPFAIYMAEWLNMFKYIWHISQLKSFITNFKIIHHQILNIYHQTNPDRNAIYEAMHLCERQLSSAFCRNYGLSLKYLFFCCKRFKFSVGEKYMVHKDINCEHMSLTWIIFQATQERWFSVVDKCLYFIQYFLLVRHILCA